MSDTRIVDASHLRVGDTIEEIFWGGAHFRVGRAQRKVWRIKQHLANGNSVLGNGAYPSLKEAAQALAALITADSHWSYSIVEVDG